MEGQSVVVIGAGPAGTCAAMSLANAGASVVVYERRSESTFVEDEGEPYAIVLEKRALDALLDAGFLDADFHGSTYVSMLRNPQPKTLEPRSAAQFHTLCCFKSHPSDSTFHVVENYCSATVTLFLRTLRSAAT